MASAASLSSWAPRFQSILRIVAGLLMWWAVAVEARTRGREIYTSPVVEGALVAGASRWRWFCDNCDDGECEQHWLTRAVSSGGSDAA